jgi:hypothetical protein
MAGCAWRVVGLLGERVHRRRLKPECAATAL